MPFRFKPAALRRPFLILICNLLILSVGIFFIECFFGNWWGTRGMQRLYVPHDVAVEKDISDLYPSETGKILYRRDHNGLRGPFTDVTQVDLLTLGGSTTDQSDISEGDTWQDILAKDFKKEGKEVQIANAGINGQSSLGHARSLRVWLRHIPGLKPKYALIYVGINDVCGDEKMFAPFFEDERSMESFFIRRSALYFLYRTVLGRLGHIRRSLNFGPLVSPPDTPGPAEEVGPFTDQPLLESYGGLFDYYLDRYEMRLRRLLRRLREFNAGTEPIFVTQKRYYFRDNEGRLFAPDNKSECWGQEINYVDHYYIFDLLNQRTLKFCADEKLTCFDLAGELEFEFEDFFDLEHNTPSGSAKIGHYLHKKMKNMF